MDTTRVARNVSATVVAGIAAWSSYWHMLHVALRYGERLEVAATLPLSVDGMLVVASVAMVDDRRHRRRVRPAARIAFVIGVAASVAANIAAAQPHIGARIIAAWPAVALLLVVEMLSRTGRPQPAPDTSHDVTVPARIGPQPLDEAARGADLSLVPPAAPAADTSALFLPPRHPAGPVGGGAASSTRPAVEATEAPVATASPAPAPPASPVAGAGDRRPATVTRQLALAIIAAEPDLPRTEVAVRIGVSPRRLREVMRTTP